MAMNDPSLWALTVNAAASIAAWVSGESGRVIVGSGLGGFSRWLHSGNRNVRDGIIAVAGGSLSGTYLWPFVLAIMGFPFGGLEPEPNNIAGAAFIAGAGGMALIKVMLSMVEAKTSARTNGEE